MKLKIVNPCTNASGTQISGLSNRISPQVATREDPELARGDHKMPRGRLFVQLAHLLARDGRPELGA